MLRSEDERSALMRRPHSLMVVVLLSCASALAVGAGGEPAVAGVAARVPIGRGAGAPGRPRARQRRASGDGPAPRRGPGAAERSAPPDRPVPARRRAVGHLRPGRPPHDRRRGVHQPWRAARAPLPAGLRPGPHHARQRPARAARGRALPAHPVPARGSRRPLRAAGAGAAGPLHERRERGAVEAPADPRHARPGGAGQHRHDELVRGVRDRPRRQQRAPGSRDAGIADGRRRRADSRAWGRRRRRLLE